MKWFLALASLILWPPIAAAQPTAGVAATGDGNATTILTSQCLKCHGPVEPKGGLDLSRRAAALKGGKSGVVLVPGSRDESLLLDKIAEGEMPPNSPLAPDQVETLRAWVKAGAHYPSEPLALPRAGLDWWSLQPIRRVAVPSARTTGPKTTWARNPIDTFVRAKLASAGLEPAEEAPRAVLIRRLSFDLTGLPPSPDAVDQFVADPDPRAYELLVDRLLASPHYGERWGRHWLDVVRFGESEGYETNLPRPNAWPYRDYVIRAFNRDTPFPQFVLEQLAGDTLDDHHSRQAADWLTQSATGFLVGGSHDVVGNQTVEGMLQQRADDLDDMITATGTTFLGLTLQCARCHDHKFDPITQKDYYGMQTILAGVNHAERAIAAPDAEARVRQAGIIRAELTAIEARLDATDPLAHPGQDRPARPMVNFRRNVERFAPVKARMVRLTILATSNQIEPCLDEVEVYSAPTSGSQSPRNVALATAGGRAAASSEYPNAAIHKIAHLNDGRTGNSQSWISNSPGKGSVTLSWPEPIMIDRIVWGRDREGMFGDRLATEYYVEAAVEADHWTVVASSIDRAPFDPMAKPEAAAPLPVASGDQLERARLFRRQAELRTLLADMGATAKVYAGTFSQPGKGYLLVRGDPTRKGPEVQPAGLSVLRPALVLDPESPEALRRAALAHWIADPANPLPARVMVNRVWHYHFGRGLVATPSDFGFNGAAASHPQLLDWLATAYIECGWRLKPLHRLIVTSATYRQSSRLNEKAHAIDRDNRLLWRMTPRRLEAESIRDAILASSGKLDSRMGGPGYNVWEKNTNYVAIYKPRGELSGDAFRRMIYQFKPRSQGDPTFAAFDCPDAALAVPRRNVSTTALQALNLLNSEFVIRQAASFAERLEKVAGSDPAPQAKLAFRLAFGRSPTEPELTAAVLRLDPSGSSMEHAPCRALYNANEFIYVP